MDKSEVKEIVDECLRPLMWALQVQDWSVVVSYEVMSDSENVRAAKIEWLYSYHRAILKLEPNYVLTREQLLSLLVHELCHLFQAEFTLFKQASLEHVDGHRAGEVLERVWESAGEFFVGRMINMFDHGLKQSPEALVKIGKQALKLWKSK